MIDMLLNVSPDYIYLHGKKPKLVSDIHRPYFLAFTRDERDILSARNRLLKDIKNASSESDPLSKIDDVGEVEEYRSFWDFDRIRKVFKVYTKKSYFVPEVSDYLFFNYDLYTAEHDIPYHQRALIDLAVDEKCWLFDTNGKKEKLKVMVYDIETTDFTEGKEVVPIDIIGYASFDISFESKSNLAEERFEFNLIDYPSTWEDIEVRQMISRNCDEEIENLFSFCKILEDFDIVSGHNIVGFDNYQIYSRINWILKNFKDNLSDKNLSIFQDFVSKYSRIDRSFYFGVHSEAVQFYPCTLDTYHGVRKFYSFLDDFSLKSVAPFLGVVIKDRILLAPSQIKIDERTLKYNEQDVKEQLGVTLNLIQQALPLSFITCMPFDMLFSSGAVGMWDHMAMIRAKVQKKIVPPTCRVLSIAETLVRNFKGFDSKEEIVKRAKQIKDQLSKDLLRVIKYGDEMPSWVEDPYVIYNEKHKDIEDILNYHFPGGMTIKPDKDALSHFIPWYYVIVADVGAMYPTILKAMNIGADTVRVAKKDEQPDEFVWLKKIPIEFLEKRNINYREVSEDDDFADKGYMIGVKIDKKPGLVNCAMSGIMGIIGKIKSDLKTMSKTGKKEEIERLKMMYQSLKGARNAGTHGILSAPTVSGRQFNLWGAAAITTKGQMILSDTLKHLKSKGIRVVYGDTDGIYLACSRSARVMPRFSKALGLSPIEDEDHWLTKPEIAVKAIEECDRKWQKELNYPDFELEPEIHDAMIFVKHKNYLIFDCKDDQIEMIAKGNNFIGSEKANIARKVLKEIMIEVLRKLPEWEKEDDAREKMKEYILEKTRESISKLSFDNVDIDDLTIVQSVQPSDRYKPTQNGSLSAFGERASALENILGYKIKSRIKLRFVVTKKPLPGITNPSKSGVKPIDYMYPVDLLKDRNQIDLDWYKKMIENYIQGAFGLSKVVSTEQTGLDAWM